MKASMFKLAAIALAAAGASQVAHATANTTEPINWRVTKDHVASNFALKGQSFDGVAYLEFSTPEGGMACSGSLLAGGAYVLTAAHCADNFSSMIAAFGMYGGVAKEVRTVTQAFVHSGWTGALGQGNDIAVLKLDKAVTSVQGFHLSQGLDEGKKFLMMGYGTTGLGTDPNNRTNWNDWGWMHWGMNTADLADTTGNGHFEYIADYDNGDDEYNTLSLLGLKSGTGIANEALIAGGDSGGGDFVWDAKNNRWLLSGVHSWGADYSTYLQGDCTNGNKRTCNSSSFGDISGSTAVFSHRDWINSITNPVPEPETYALMLAGLGAIGAVARRRKQQA